MEPCLWIAPIDDFGEAAWKTQCKSAFEFLVDGPAENEFKFCPYCGGPIRLQYEPR